MKKTIIFVATALGVLAAIYLVLNIGFAAIAAAIVSFGWTGFVVVCGLMGVQFALLSAAWCVLVPTATFKTWPTFIWGRAVRDSAGDILPLTQLAGYIEKTPYATQTCVSCHFFIDPDDCEIVEGPVNPTGYCNYYAD